MDESVFSADCITARLFEAALVLVEPRILVRAEERAMTEADWLASTDPAAMLRHLRRGMDFQAVPSGHMGTPAAQPSDRKLRLFACACCRLVWGRLTDDAPCGRCDNGTVWQFGMRVACPDCGGAGRVNRSRRAVEVAERFSDGEATEEELEDAFEAARRSGNATECYDAAHTCELDAIGAAREVAREPRSVSPAAQADLLRCIFGNPFRAYAWTRIHDCKPSGHNLQFLDEAWRDWNDRTVPRLAEAIYAERAWDRLPVLADALEDAGCADAELLGHLRGRETCLACRGTGRLDADHRAGTIECRGCEPWGCGTRPLRTPHCRGCWAVDLILGKS